MYTFYIAMNKNLLFERPEAALHADADGYLWYTVTPSNNKVGFHLDTTTCGWFGDTFFRTPEGLYNTRMESKGFTATLDLKPQAQVFYERNGTISDGPVDHAFMLSINGVAGMEVV
jgi:hypothetical protein